MTCAMFKLQFDPRWISSLASQYLIAGNAAAKDAAMLAAGKNIACRRLSRSNLETIYKWKSPRFVGLMDGNKDADISRCLLRAVEAIEAADDRSAIVALIRASADNAGLRGVQVPVASAILTAIKPDRFTVIDYKALAALDCPQESPGVGFYLGYLCACRRIAAENNVSLRTLDRALWQWWTNQEKASA